MDEFILRDESHIWVVLKMDDLDLGGSIRAGPDLCDQVLTYNIFDDA